MYTCADTTPNWIPYLIILFYCYLYAHYRRVWMENQMQVHPQTS